MESRREFLKKATVLAGLTAGMGFLPESIQKALAIDAEPGSTYLDAEHIVFLMQENRSLDHCFGTLKGVRGFNDPRAMKKADGLPVFVQSSKNRPGETYAPFHLDIDNSKSTWMYDLPHGWRDMISARNDGRMDNWLDAKRSNHAPFRDVPFTMGFYRRSDIPFYYAMADAFTVCDQHFCSSLTGTSPNRSFFWTGTVREDPHSPHSKAYLENPQYKPGVKWKTFPERLQEAGIPWKIYQNELSVGVGMTDEEVDWLGNFGDNNMEYHDQYGVRFHPAHRQYMQARLEKLEKELRDNAQDEGKLAKEIAQLKEDLAKYSQENFDKQDDFFKEIHRNAFVTNHGDPDYHRLEKVTYRDENGEMQETSVPAGDIFYQFRKDVNEDKLPTVSWLVAPGIFSDHPARPWYGAWYVSEALDILTKNPEVWKKTIFVLTYDENDGFFDHVPPFVPPHPTNAATGKTTEGIDTAVDYITKDDDPAYTANGTLESPIGLGYRVPMIVASPWTKGGWVNSEVLDLTSPIQFLEHFVYKKTGKKIIETNISSWRRKVCGDMTSVFYRRGRSDAADKITPVVRNEHIGRINNARSKDLPSNFIPLDSTDRDNIRHHGMPDWFNSFQEKGVKPACAIPYNMAVNARIENGAFTLDFGVGKCDTANKKVAVPFYAVSHNNYEKPETKGRVWNFAVEQQKALNYPWKLDEFLEDTIDMDVHGPNGFFRSFKCSKSSNLGVRVTERRRGRKPILVLEMVEKGHRYDVRDVSYKLFEGKKTLSRSNRRLEIDLTASFGWYDVEITSAEDPTFYLQFAGHVETGYNSFTDPLMGS